ncbi:MAG: hypothetical protein ACSHWN_08400 [Methylophilaceae bacterium]
MAKMQEFSKLSLWDVCHYWHKYNPQKTDPNNLPIDVQQSIRALTYKLRNTLYFKCTLNSIPHRLFYEEPKSLRLLARDFQRKLKKVYSGRSYNKKFLKTLDLGRLSLLMWCQETNTKPPSFWFDEDDPILDKPVEDNFSVLPEDEKRKYGYFAMFEIPQESKFQQKSGSNFLIKDSYELADIAEESKITKAVKGAISKRSAENAKAAYKKLDKHKEKYIKFVLESNIKNKSQTARYYFSGLNSEGRKEIVITYYKEDYKECERRAVRTLTTALREHVRMRA